MTLSVVTPCVGPTRDALLVTPWVGLTLAVTLLLVTPWVGPTP